MKKKYYYESMSMAECILDGYTVAKVAKEFNISERTVTRRIHALATYRPDIYKKVMKTWHEKDDFEGVVID